MHTHILYCPEIKKFTNYFPLTITILYLHIGTINYKPNKHSCISRETTIPVQVQYEYKRPYESCLFKLMLDSVTQQYFTITIRTCIG